MPSTKKPVTSTASKNKRPALTKASAPETPPTLASIPLDQITPHPDNPRTFPKRDKDDPTLRDLAGSIKSVGLLEPILVRPQGDGFQLLAGERRWRASRLAGLDSIAAIVRDLDDTAAVEVLVTENLQRESLHPLEEARGIQALIERAGWNASDVAARLGKSPAWVSQRARLTNLSPEWVAAIGNPECAVSQWPLGHLLLISRLEPAAQNDVAAEHEFLEEGDYELPDREWISRIVADALRTLRLAPWNLKDEGLYPEAGGCLACRKRSTCHPGLFEDEDEKEPEKTERCLDIVCWNEKMARYLTAKEGALRAKHGDMVKVHNDPSFHGNDGALKNYEWENAKKGDDGAQPAFVVDGKGAGSMRWIQRRSFGGTTSKARPTDPEGNPVPKPLSERRAGLDRRRKAHAVVYIVKAINAITPFPHPPHVKDAILELLLPLVAVFGTRHREDSSQMARNRSYDEPPKEQEQNECSITEGSTEEEAFSEEQDDEEEAIYRERFDNPQIVWTSFFQPMAGDVAACAENLWKEVRPVLTARLTYQGTQTDIRKLWADAEHCCAALGMNAHEFLDAATSAIKEPKAWDKLNEDGTPKASGRARKEDAHEATA